MTTLRNQKGGAEETLVKCLMMTFSAMTEEVE